MFYYIIGAVLFISTELPKLIETASSILMRLPLTFNTLPLLWL